MNMCEVLSNKLLAENIKVDFRVSQILLSCDPETIRAL